MLPGICVKPCRFGYYVTVDVEEEEEDVDVDVDVDEDEEEDEDEEDEEEGVSFLITNSCTSTELDTNPLASGN